MMFEPLYTVKEVAKLLKMKVNTNKRKRGDINGTHFN
nr:MAG TPA: hypothetical protein [Caudoviricetes sp.]